MVGKGEGEERVRDGKGDRAREREREKKRRDEGRVVLIGQVFACGFGCRVGEVSMVLRWCGWAGCLYMYGECGCARGCR